MRDLSQAVSALFNATMEIGIAGNVTIYTDGAFNRTMAPTPRGGSMPAWGGHQLVIGGSVLGGQIYGSFPDFALGGPSDAAKTGIWIPGVTKAQYYATLAQWAGLPDWELHRVFRSLPVLGQSGLGFVA
jgi:uncharacterized protein (DUF1501 family)